MPGPAWQHRRSAHYGSATTTSTLPVWTAIASFFPPTTWTHEAEISIFTSSTPTAGSSRLVRCLELGRSVDTDLDQLPVGEPVDRRWHKVVRGGRARQPRGRDRCAEIVRRRAAPALSRCHSAVHESRPTAPQSGGAPRSCGKPYLQLDHERKVRRDRRAQDPKSAGPKRRRAQKAQGPESAGPKRQERQRQTRCRALRGSRS